MAKRGPTKARGGASRAQRKQAGARKRHADARGLARVESESEGPGDSPSGAEEHARAGARPKLPLAGKIGIFLLLLFGAIWVAAQFRQGAPE